MRHRAFPGYGPETDARYERAGHFLRATVFGREAARAWCDQNSVPLRKAADESSGSAGGFLVPQDFAKAIIDLREMYGAFRRRARIINMGSDSTAVARRTGAGTSASFTAGNTAITASTATIDSITLTARKVAALVLTSNELEEDADTDLVDYVANEMAFAFAAKEDDCAFNGDGSSTYGSMVGLAAMPTGYKSRFTAANNTYGALTAADLSNLMSSVRASAIGNAAWFMSQIGFAVTLCRLAGATGNGYLDYAVVDGIRTPLYLGFPVILTQKLPQVTSSLSTKLMMAFGDMYAAGVLGQRRAITVARSDERYFDSDQIGIRGTERFHAVINDIGDATNFGAVAGLFGS